MTLAIAAVIKDEDVEAETVEDFDGKPAVGDVAGVAVTEEQGFVTTGSGYEPAVEGDAIRGGEVDVFVWKSPLVGSAFDAAKGDEDESRLEEAKEKNHDPIDGQEDRYHGKSDT